MTACTWVAGCTDQARHLVWRRGGWGQIETEATCGRHRGDALVAGYRSGVPGSDTEQFEVRGERALEVPVVGALPWEPRAVLGLVSGGPEARAWRRSRLAAVAGELADRLARPVEATVDG